MCVYIYKRIGCDWKIFKRGEYGQLNKKEIKKGEYDFTNFMTNSKYKQVD